MWNLIGKLLLLGAARRWAKRPTAAAETAALVLVLNERRLGRGARRDVLLRTAHIIFLPAAVIKTVRLVRRLTCGKRRGPGLGAPPLPPLPLSPPPVPAADANARGGAGGAAAVAEGRVGQGDPADPLEAAATAEAAARVPPSFRHQLPPMPRQVPRPQWGLLQLPEVSPEYAPWVGCLRNVLAQQGLRSLPPGMDPDGLELTRYLLYGGLLAATKPHEAARALGATAARVTGTVNWRGGYPFLTEGELTGWSEVTWWAGPDPDGTLWLHLHLANAMTRCNRGESRQCVQAIVSQLEHGTRVLMRRGRAGETGAAGGAGATGGVGVGSGSSGGGSSGAETPTLSSASTVPYIPAAEGAGPGWRSTGGGGAVSTTNLVAAAAAAAAAGIPRGGSASSSGRGREGTTTGGSLSGGLGSFFRRRSIKAVKARGSAGSDGEAAEVGKVDDRIRVVVIGSGSNVRQALRMFPVFREFIRLVQLHYPGRLRAMYLVGMPRGLRMSLGAVLNLLSQETRQKIKICKVEDLPDCISASMLAREGAAQQLRQQQQQQQQLRNHQTHRRTGLLPALWPSAASAHRSSAGDDAGDLDGEADELASVAQPLLDGECEGFGDAGSLGFACSRRRSYAAGSWLSVAGRLLAAAAAMVALALALSSSPTHGSMTQRQQAWLATPGDQLGELRLLLLRAVPALVMAAMACLTYKSLLGRP